MSDPRRGSGHPSEGEVFEQDLEPGIEREDRRALVAIATRLSDERPLPTPRMRSTIRSGLLASGGYRSRRGAGALIGAYGSAGVLLLAVAAVGLAGVGPFAA